MPLAGGARFGPYEIIAPIGAGGMGEVYRARDPKLNRDVALKILPELFAADPERRARFSREAQVLASLNHPHIGAIYGIEESNGVTALVLELVEGPTLADRVARGPVPVDEALTIAVQIADALDAAHEKGIVHRDLKPANIKLTADDRVKVLDFGLAKAMTDDVAGNAALSPSASPTMTAMASRLGVIVGTAAYMSPEQAKGKPVDKRADIWAFGCVLYEMLTATRAFGGEDIADFIAAVLTKEPDWAKLPANTPARVIDLLRRCLQKDPRQRLRDIGDARSDLDRGETGIHPSAGVKKAARLPWVLAGALLGIGVTAALLWIRRDAGTARAPSSEPRLTRLTSDASFATEPALSRDGTLVVYASDREGPGQLDLWLQRTTGGQPLRLTSDPADDRTPDISPDGSLIAFRSDRNGAGVYVIPVLGGDARLVAPGGRAPRFSPDGARLAYMIPTTWLGGLTGLSSAIYVVSPSGGTAKRVADGIAIAAFPLWSPDGRSLLFFGGRPGASDWWWVPVDGGTPVATGAYSIIGRAGLSGLHENDRDVVAAAWTKDGVLFSARLGDSVNVWRLTISEQTGLAAEASLERVTHGVGADVQASADNLGRMAFRVATDVGESLTLPIDPNRGTVTGPVVAQTFEAGEGPGRNSLDDQGSLLVYVRRRGTELWVKDLATGRERHVLTAQAVANPVLSHDGTKVAYGTAAGGASSNVGYVVPVAGGTPRKVCDACTIGGWFADNRRLLTSEWDERASRARARAIDIESLNAVDLLVSSGRVARFDLSPDERWLVFTQSDTSILAPVRIGSPPPEREWVTVFKRLPGSAERPCGWSPDSRLLYVLLERDGFRDLYAQRIDTTTGRPAGEPFAVAHFHSPRRRWGSTPFGSGIVRNAFVFTQVETTGSIWLLESSPNVRR